MGAEKGADMAHRQRNVIGGVFPRIKAHLRVRREMRKLSRVSPERRLLQHFEIAAADR